MFSSLFGWVENLSTALQIIIYSVLIIGGMFALIKGADMFVGGASNIAKLLKVPTLIIGLTIVSIGTSLPEAAISVSGAIAGSADISIGNIVGSNLFNILVVLGVSLIFVPIIVDKGVVKRDLPILIMCGILLLVFMLIGNEGNMYILSRIECGILFALFIFYIVLSIVQAKRQDSVKKQEQKVENEEPKNVESVEKAEQKPKTWLSILLLVLGLVCIVVGGDFVVIGAKNIALKLGMSEMLVGLTIVAIGTSLPELVTSIVAAKKGENDIALGNVVGSSIFNILLIVGLAGLITPLTVDAVALIDIIIMIVVFIGLFVFTLFKNKLPRFLGWIMLSLYVIYFAYIILRDFVFVV